MKISGVGTQNGSNIAFHERPTTSVSSIARRPNSELGRWILGVRPEFTLSHAQEMAMCAVATWDLSRIQRRLERQEAIPHELVDEAIAEFRRYLALRVIHDQPVPMLSGWVDEVWHACILDSRFYFELCTAVFGSYLHHQPGEPDADLDTEWDAFEDAYLATFAEMSAIWSVWRPDLPWFQTAEESEPIREEGAARELSERTSNVTATYLQRAQELTGREAHRGTEG
jgi:hypothetical protein